MKATLAQLLVPLTSNDFKKSIYNVLGKVGVDVTTWKPGAVVRTIIAALAIVLAALSSLIPLIAASGFLALSSGFWLTLVARYVYGVERDLATFGTGVLRLTNTAGGLYSVDAGDLTAINLDTKKTYHNASSFTLNPGDTITIDIVADEVGAASTSIIGTITALQTALVGVTCTNVTAVVGLDDELDPDLVVRCLDKLGSFSPNGPSDAYAFVARGALRSDGSRIGVNRVLVTRDGYGNVYVTLATPAGIVAGDQDDPSTDLGAIRLSMLKQCAPLCVAPFAFSAVTVPQDVTFTAYAYNVNGLTNALVISQISTALATLFARLPIGGHVLVAGPGYVFLDELKAAITAAVPSVFHVVFSLPSVDVPLAPGQVLTLGAVTGLVSLVAKDSL